MNGGERRASDGHDESTKVGRRHAPGSSAATTIEADHACSILTGDCAIPARDHLAIARVVARSDGLRDAGGGAHPLAPGRSQRQVIRDQPAIRASWDVAQPHLPDACGRGLQTVVEQLERDRRRRALDQVLRRHDDDEPLRAPRRWLAHGYGPRRQLDEPARPARPGPRCRSRRPRPRASRGAAERLNLDPESRATCSRRLVGSLVVVRDVDRVAAEYHRDVVVETALISERKERLDPLDRDPIPCGVEARAGPLGHAPIRIRGEQTPRCRP